MSTHEGTILTAKRGRPSPAVDILKANKKGQNWYSAEADLGVLHGDAHWRHLANMTEPSVCGDNAALCYFFHHLLLLLFVLLLLLVILLLNAPVTCNLPYA